MPEEGFAAPTAPAGKWAGSEFQWVQVSRAAAAALARGRHAAAREACRKALRLAETFHPDDPRRAASWNNLGCARRGQGDLGDAERLYGQAMAAWEAALRWVEAMQLPQRARSSLFHFRMERKHRARYDRFERGRCQEVLAAGRAATENNLAGLLQARGRPEEARALYRRAVDSRARALGEADPGTRRMRANLSASTASPRTGLAAAGDWPEAIDFLALGEERGWIVDRPPELTDEGRLMAAVLLAQVLPGPLPGPGSSGAAAPPRPPG
ncbi:MAG: hypothetical protein Kow0092_23320 [Deferrisomatales bacterium]